MPWLDSIRPSIPVVHMYTGNDSLLFNFEAGNKTDSLKGFALYKADSAFNIDSARVFRFIPNDQHAETVFSAADLMKNPNSRYYVTAISKTNNESDPILIYPLNRAGKATDDR
jgi:hypothetical protein